MQEHVGIGRSSFDKVLLATDFSPASQAAFEAAVDTCRRFGAGLSIVHVFEYANNVPPESGGQLIEVEAFYKEAQRDLDRLCRLAEDAGVRCDGTIAGGLPDAVILDMIAEKEIGLVIVGTNASRGLERLIFGSTAEAVVRQAPCAVMTVGPKAVGRGGAEKIDGPVVFATDFDASTIHALQYAAAVCDVTGSLLHCVHVLPVTMEGGVKSRLVPEMMTEALCRIALESGVSIKAPVCATVFGGDVPLAVVEYARRQRARLIVLGVRRAAGVRSHGPADSTFRLMAEAPCPVLTVAFGDEKRVAAVGCRRCEDCARKRELAVFPS